jgi:predicted metal-dependent hydrolase
MIPWMQLGLPFGAQSRVRTRLPARDTILVGRRSVVVAYVRHRRARHYIIHVTDDGSLRVTVPRGGSRHQADRFVREKASWIEREQYRLALGRSLRRRDDERRVCLDGEELVVEIADSASGRDARFGSHVVPVPPGGRVRTALDRYLRALADVQLPARLAELAGATGHGVARVTVRAQRSRWGSCSPSGRISLNWRLIQVPPSVRDYVLLHELTHLTHLDHSKRFWRELERVCPWHREARVWLRQSGRSGLPLAEQNFDL